MKLYNKLCLNKTIFILLFLSIVIHVNIFKASAENVSSFNFAGIHTFGNVYSPDSRINIQQIDDYNVLILPSSVKPESVILFSDIADTTGIRVIGELGEATFFNGVNLDFTRLCNKDDYKLKFVYNSGEASLEYEIRFLFSENIPAIYITSDNFAEKGRVWVESSYNKSNKATGRMVMQKSDGELVYDGALTQIKGRGNNTWSAPKKPYQIKTAKKVDLLGTGNPDNESKTWVLLANYRDPVLLNNTIALNLGKALGMGTNIENMHIDLYYDGEYRGNYLLSEKVETGAGRVNIPEEKGVSGAIEAPVLNTAETAGGVFYRYCENSSLTEKGFLLEIDYGERAVEEACYFRSLRGQHVVVKSPEYASKEQMEYIADFFQGFEDAVFNGGVNPSNGKVYSDYVDLRSMVCYYLVNEFTKARDVFSSSAYLYKTHDENKLQMGPLWDYDLSFGKSMLDGAGDISPYGISQYNTEMCMRLFVIDSFHELVGDIYLNEFYPMIKNIVLGEYDSVRDKIRSSAVHNSKLWHGQTDWNAEAENLRNFIDLRADSLKEFIEYYVPAPGKYKDVFPTAWFLKDVIEATRKGLMNGVGNGCFSPLSQVKRAEIAQVLFNKSELSGFPFEEKFSDVKADSWFSNAVMWAVNSDIMDAVHDEMFMPEEFITREMFVYSMYRFAGRPQVDTNNLLAFSDAGDVTEYVRDALEWAINEQILKGNDNNELNPHGYLSRAELAAFLLRFDEKV